MYLVRAPCKKTDRSVGMSLDKYEYIIIIILPTISCSISPLSGQYGILWTALCDRGLVSGMNTITSHVILDFMPMDRMHVRKKWRPQEMSVIMRSCLMDFTFDGMHFIFWSGVRRLI